jgi:hypothetical protein
MSRSRLQAAGRARRARKHEATLARAAHSRNRFTHGCLRRDVPQRAVTSQRTRPERRGRGPSRERVAVPPKRDSGGSMTIISRALAAASYVSTFRSEQGRTAISSTDACGRTCRLATAPPAIRPLRNVALRLLALMPALPPRPGRATLRHRPPLSRRRSSHCSPPPGPPQPFPLNQAGCPYRRGR